MSSPLRTLWPLFQREREACRPVVLATVTRTEGPTYTKAGSQMLICEKGEYAGLLSGGCLEGDLAERGRDVLTHGRSQIVRYDARGPDDLIFGLGSGCEGAMEILLQRLDSAEDWQPLTRLIDAWRARRADPLLIVVRSDNPSLPLGSGVFMSDSTPFGGFVASAEPLIRAAEKTHELPAHYLSEVFPTVDLLRLALAPPPRVLLLGAGPDALPVAQLASFLGWHLTVIDHRPHFARAERFPTAELVLDGGPAVLAELLSSARGQASFSAAIVMSHHFMSDRGYLQALAGTDISYVGLLGPVNRRERLLALVGPHASRLRARLCSPVGLDLGADTPESIALAIAAEIQGRLTGRERIESLSSQPGLRERAPTPSQRDPIRT